MALTDFFPHGTRHRPLLISTPRSKSLLALILAFLALHNDMDEMDWRRYPRHEFDGTWLLP
jgi:hypothetical protein